jgi:hypothetical protein
MKFRKFKDVSSPEEAEELGNYWMNTVKLEDVDEFYDSLSSWNLQVMQWLRFSRASVPFGETYLKNATKLGRYLSGAE